MLTTAPVWFTAVADRKPKTFSPAWIAAGEKYKQSMNHDPIYK